MKILKTVMIAIPLLQGALTTLAFADGCISKTSAWTTPLDKSPEGLFGAYETKCDFAPGASIDVNAWAMKLLGKDFPTTGYTSSSANGIQTLQVRRAEPIPKSSAIRDQQTIIRSGNDRIEYSSETLAMQNGNQFHMVTLLKNETHLTIVIGADHVAHLDLKSSVSMTKPNPMAAGKVRSGTIEGMESDQPGEAEAIAKLLQK